MKMLWLSFTLKKISQFCPTSRPFNLLTSKSNLNQGQRYNSYLTKMLIFQFHKSFEKSVENYLLALEAQRVYTQD